MAGPRFDMEVVTAGLAAMEKAGFPPALALHDVLGRRAVTDPQYVQLTADHPAAPDVTATDHTVTTPTGDLLVRWYRRFGDAPGSAVLYLHGGGMYAGSVATHDRVVAGYAQATGVPALSVDYRKAPEHPHPTPVEDCYAALVWLTDHADELGVDPARIAVMGDSAGGGLAAGVAVMARDRGGPELAAQLLLYPMLDDRTTRPPEGLDLGGWTYDDNTTGWTALLGDRIGTDDVPPSAAPARLLDHVGLAPAYLEVGELDILAPESVAYALALLRAGVPVELHVHPGCPHGYDVAARQAAVTLRAYADRVRVLQAL